MQEQHDLQNLASQLQHNYGEDTCPEEPDDIEKEWIDAVHDRDLRRA